MFTGMSQATLFVCRVMTQHEGCRVMGEGGSDQFHWWAGGPLQEEGRGT